MDLRYDGPAPQWAGLPDTEVLDSSEGSVRLKVARDTEISAVLARVTDHDAIASFSYQPPTLSDLFREAVST